MQFLKKVFMQRTLKNRQSSVPASRVVWLTSFVAFFISFFLAPSNASAADSSLCGSWASVSGWKGNYNLTGNGTSNYGGGASATVSYSSSGTVHLMVFDSPGCPAGAQWAALMDSGNANGSASYQLTVPCTPGGGVATETWSTSQVASGHADLQVDSVHGSIVFFPYLISAPFTVTTVGCNSRSSYSLPAAFFTLAFSSQMPKINLPDEPGKTISIQNSQFSALDGSTGITVNWTLNFTFTPDCDVPDDETTAWHGWDETYDTASDWKQTLISGTGASFSGLMVKEVDAGGAGDTCYFDESAVGKITGLSGGTWTVNDDNTWAYDTVGWAPAAVLYYQVLKPRAPCGYTVHQQMQITCYDGSQHNYGPVNTLQGIIGENDVTSIRAGHHASRRTN